MKSLTLRASSPAGIIILGLTSTAMALMILFTGPEIAPRLWLAIFFGGVAMLVAWGLSRSRRLDSTMTDMALWALLIAHTVLVARIRDPRDLAESGGIILEIYVEIGTWLLVIFYALARIAVDPRRLGLLWGSSSRYALLLFAAALGSASYSADPAITLAWTLKLVSILLMATAFFDSSATIAAAQRFARATYLGLVLMLVQFVFLGILNPSAAIDRNPYNGMWRAGGYLVPATQLSTVAGMVIVLAVADHLARRPGRFSLPTVLCATALMLASVGRTGIFATVVATLILLLLFRQFRRAVIAVIGAGVVFMVVPSLIDVSRDYVARGQSDREIASLTGRVDLWRTAVDLFWDRPLLGWGYVSGGRVALLQSYRHWRAAHSHNAWLEILLGLGIVGAIILLCLVGRTAWNAKRALLPHLRSSPDDPNSVLAAKILALVTLMTIDGMLTAGYGGPPRFEMTILVGCAFSADLLCRIRASEGSCPPL